MSDDLIDKKQKLLFELAISNSDVFIKCARVLKSSYFDAPLDRVVKFTLDHFNKYHSLPKTKVIDAETGILLEEHDIDESDVLYLLDEIEQFCRDQAMIQAILKSVDLVHSGKVNEVQELVRKALLVKLDDDVGLDLFENPEERIRTMAAMIDERPIGIPNLDQYINNIRRGELGIFYGTSSSGKSVTLANCANLLARQNLDCVIISLELGDLLYAKRMDTIATGFDIGEHENLAPQIAEALGKMKEESGKITIKKMPVGATVSDIRTYLMEYHLKFGKNPDVLIVDYLALMDAETNRGKGAFEEQKEIAFGLRQIAEDIDAYGLSAGQMSRDANDVLKVHAGHVSGGMSVINACDWAVAMVASEEDIDNNQAQVVQLKLRNGARTSKPIMIYRNPKTLEIKDTPFDFSKKQHSTPLANKKPSEGIDNSKGRDKLMRALNKRK